MMIVQPLYGRSALRLSSETPLILEPVTARWKDVSSIYCGLSIASTYLEVAINLAAVAKHYCAKAFINVSQMTVKEMDIYATTHSPQQKQGRTG
jgi:hypothetical protein